MLAFDEVELSAGGTGDGFRGRVLHGRNRAGLQQRYRHHFPICFSQTNRSKKGI